MLWKRFFELWQQLLWWERQLLIWFAHLTLARRAVLPAMAYQAGGLALVVWLEPDEPVLWSLVFVVSSVYVLIFHTLRTR